MTGSLGIATYPADADTPETMLRNADTALYAAKGLGRDTVARYAPEPRITAADGAPEVRW